MNLEDGFPLDPIWKSVLIWWFPAKSGAERDGDGDRGGGGGVGGEV